MATYYFRNSNGNWSAANSWSTSSGGPANGAVPTAGDDAIVDSNSGSCVVDIVAVCKSLNFTGYTGTLTMTNGITISGNITLSSTMTISGAGNLTFNASSTWVSNNKTWPNSVTVSATATITINSFTFTIGGTLTLSAAVTFAGTNGFNTKNFTCTTAGLTHTLVAGNTYTITGVMTTTGTAASHIALTSSSAGTYATLTLTGTQDNGFLNGTWINSSNGQTIWTYNGVLSNTINWQDLSYFPVNTSFTFLGSF